jgi:hypothetical protein
VPRSNGEEAAWDAYLSALSGEPYGTAGPRDDTPAYSGFCYGLATPPTADPPLSESVPTYEVAQASAPSGSAAETPAATPPATTPPASAPAPSAPSDRKTKPAPAPTYDPEYWNSPLVRMTNNCYS